ncbi:MAG: hypothetical protein HOV68_05965 [Streptomycetaceae bacterium]|nr:hypothetical protein [Streptomycetaceae bacterium]
MESTVRVLLPDPSTHVLDHKCSAHLLTVEERAARWSWQSLRTESVPDAELTRLLGQNHALMTCLMYPNAPLSRLTNICEWFAYWFLLDDVYTEPDRYGFDLDRAASVAADLMTVLETGKAPRRFEFGPALADIWGRIRADLRPEMRDRFVHLLAKMLDGFQVAVAARSTEKSVDLEYYWKHRYYDSAMAWCFLMIEYALDVDLGRDAPDSVGFDALQTVALRHSILVNDLLGFRKEYVQGDGWNCVSVLCRTEDLGIQDAIDRVARMARNAEDDFAARQRRLITAHREDHPAWADYVTEMGHTLAGLIEWQYRSTRYHGVRHSWNGTRSGVVLLTPEQTLFDPTDRPGAV